MSDHGYTEEKAAKNAVANGRSPHHHQETTNNFTYCNLAPLYSPDRDCPALHGSSLGGVARTSLVGLHKDGLRVHAGHRQGWRH